MRPSHRKRNPMWPRRRFAARAVSATSLTGLLKELYPQSNSPEMERPWSYRLAYARRWITADAYYDVKPVPTGRRNQGISELLYQDSPFFSRFRKDTNW